MSGMVRFPDFPRYHEAALEVSVSEERDGDGNGDERFDGVASADHVFIFVERGAMDELDAGKLVDLHGTLRQRAEPFEIFGGELAASPESGEAGNWVKVLEVHEAADRFVVIAANENASQSLRFGNDFVRIAAVADRVPEIDDEVVSRSGSQTGVQRFKVAVNVAEKKDTHKGRIIAFPEGNDEAHLLSRRDAACRISGDGASPVSTARSCLSEDVFSDTRRIHDRAAGPMTRMDFDQPRK